MGSTLKTTDYGTSILCGSQRTHEPRSLEQIVRNLIDNRGHGKIEQLTNCIIADFSVSASASICSGVMLSTCINIVLCASLISGAAAAAAGAVGAAIGCCIGCTAGGAMGGGGR